MIHSTLIGRDVVTVRATESHGKVTGIDVMVMPLPMWRKRFGQLPTEQLNN